MPVLTPLTLPAGAGCTAITAEQFRLYLGPDLTEIRGNLETCGPWQLPVRYHAPAISIVWGPNNSAETITLYGWRIMCDLKEAGYHLEGRCSIAGRKRSAFTSSQLWQLPDGTLLDTAVIHVRPLKQ